MRDSRGRCTAEYNGVTRRLAAIAAVAFLVSASAVAATQPGLPRDRPNASDTRRARQSLLRLTDLVPSFRVDRRGRAAPQIPLCPGYPGDRSAITITGFASSAFTDGFNQMGSAVLFFKTYSDMESYWRLTARPAFAKCDASLLRTELIRGARAKTLFASELPILPTGADDATAYRTVTRYTLPGHPTYDWYQTFAFIRVGRAVAIVKIAYANQPCNCHVGIARRLALRLIDAGR
jgi:hypothetical protein